MKPLRFVFLLAGFLFLIRMFPVVIRIFVALLQGMRLFWVPILILSIVCGTIWFYRKKRKIALNASEHSDDPFEARDVTHSLKKK